MTTTRETETRPTARPLHLALLAVILVTMAIVTSIQTGDWVASCGATFLASGFTWLALRG